MDDLQQDNDNCPICCVEYTSKLRKSVNCSGCSKSICLICTKKYLLSLPVAPHCMHCKREFSSEWLDSTFNKTFRENDLRKHRIKLVMEQEKSMFPHTLTIIENRDLMERSCKLIFEQEKILSSISPRSTDLVRKETIDQLNEKKTELKKINQRLNEINVNKNEKKEMEIIKKCPECQNGVLNYKNVCYHCTKEICRKCYCVKHENDCKPDDVASYKMIVHQTKPCPNCGCRIQKTEGCDQMWCTSCNTAFNWSTLKIIQGRIHNPHYQEYLNKHQIVNTDWRDNCENNDVPFHFPYNNSYSIFQEVLRNMNQTERIQKVSEMIQKKLTQIIALLTQRSYNGNEKNVPYSLMLYQDLRIMFIKNNITEKRWFSILSLKETIRERERKFAQLDELLVSIGRDLVRNILNAKYKTYDELNENFFIPLDQARLYYNEQYKTLCKEFDIRNCKEFKSFLNTVHINEDWYIH